MIVPTVRPFESHVLTTLLSFVSRERDGKRATEESLERLDCYQETFGDVDRKSRDRD